MCCSTHVGIRDNLDVNSDIASAFRAGVEYMHTNLLIVSLVCMYEGCMRTLFDYIVATLPECEQQIGLHSWVRKCDNSNSSSEGTRDNQRTFDSALTNTNTEGLGRDRERFLLELRLRWAIRRLQDHIRCLIERKCEMRLFVVLRIQYIYRRRSRVRAARVIQKFIRDRLSTTSAICYRIPSLST